MKATNHFLGSGTSGWWDGDGGPDNRWMDGDAFDGMGIYNERAGDGGSPGGLAARSEGDGCSTVWNGDGPP